MRNTHKAPYPVGLKGRFSVLGRVPSRKKPRPDIHGQRLGLRIALLLSVLQLELISLGASSLQAVDKPQFYMAIVTGERPAHTLLALKRNDTTYLPLAAFSHLMGYDLYVDRGNGRASGHGGLSGGEFNLDISASKAMVAGHSVPFDSALIVPLSDDIYVATTLLEKWFSLSIMSDMWGDMSIKRSAMPQQSHPEQGVSPTRPVHAVPTPTISEAPPEMTDNVSNAIEDQEVHRDSTVKAPSPEDGGVVVECPNPEPVKVHEEPPANDGAGENGIVPEMKPEPLVPEVIVGTSEPSPLTESSAGVMQSSSGFTDDDALLCLLTLYRTPLSDDFMIFATPERSYIPLTEFSRLLELGIDVDCNAKKATGYVGRPGQTFLLDIPGSSVSVSGHACSCDTSHIVVTANDIYIESQMLASWLSMHIEVNRLNAAVAVKPFVPLPLQERIAREEAGGNTWGYGVYQDPGYSRMKFPYSVLNGASVDVSLRTSFVSRSPQTSQQYNASHYTRITGDLLWMNTHADFSGQIANSSDPGLLIEDGRLRLERVDPDGNLLGPLGAKTIAFGDLSQYNNLPLIGTAVIGPGGLVSSYPVSSPSLFDLVSLKGYLGPGWDVQLFRNGALLDYRPSNSFNEYEFVDIPLNYGVNELQLAFNGPQGERRTESYHYNIGQNMMKPGQWAYQASLSFPSRHSLLLNGNTSVQDESNRPGPLMAWKSTLGLTEWLTLSNYLASAKIKGVDHSYLGSGVSGYLQSMQIDADMAFDTQQSSKAMQVGVMTSIAGVSLSGRYASLDSNWVATGGSVGYRDQLEVRAGGIRLFPFLPSTSFSTDYRRQVIDDEQRNESWGISNYNQTFGITHSHRIYLQKQMLYGTTLETTDGTSSFSWMHGALHWTGEVNYQLHPERQWNDLIMSGNIDLGDDIILTNGFNYNFPQQTWRALMSMNKQGRSALLGISLNYDSESVWGAGLNLSMNFTREPRQSSWMMDGSSGSGYSAVSAMAFIDENKNRQKDESEEVIPDVGYFVNRYDHPAKSDSTGIAFLNNIASNIPANITLSPATLPDLSYVPADKGYRLVPRPGCPFELDFPVWITGEVSGLVCEVQGEMIRPVSGIIIEAVDADGKKIGTTLSGYDGFYDFEALPTGPVTLRISPEQAEKIGFEGEATCVTVPSNGGYIDNVRLVVQKKNQNRTNTEGL